MGHPVLVVNRFNYDDSSKSIFFMLNLAFEVVLRTAFVKQIGIRRFLKYKDYKSILLFAHSDCVF